MIGTLLPKPLVRNTPQIFVDVRDQFLPHIRIAVIEAADESRNGIRAFQQSRSNN